MSEKENAFPVRFTVRLRQEQMDGLAKVALAREMVPAQVVRLIVRDYIHAWEADQRARARVEGTALDAQG